MKTTALDNHFEQELYEWKSVAKDAADAAVAAIKAELEEQAAAGAAMIQWTKRDVEEIAKELLNEDDVYLAAHGAGDMSKTLERVILTTITELTLAKLA